MTGPLIVGLGAGTFVLDFSDLGPQSPISSPPPQNLARSALLSPAHPCSALLIPCSQCAHGGGRPCLQWTRKYIISILRPPAHPPCPYGAPWLPGRRFPALGDTTSLLAPPGVYLLRCPNRGEEHGILEGVPPHSASPRADLKMPVRTLPCIGGGTQRMPPDNWPGRCRSGLTSGRGAHPALSPPPARVRSVPEVCAQPWPQPGRSLHFRGSSCRPCLTPRSSQEVRAV